MCVCVYVCIHTYTHTQVMEYYQRAYNSTMLAKGKFSAEEDAVLSKVVAKHGDKDWKLVATSHAQPLVSLSPSPLPLYLSLPPSLPLPLSLYVYIYIYTHTYIYIYVYIYVYYSICPLARLLQ